MFTNRRTQFRRRSYLRDAQVNEWANWDSDCWGIPSHVHQQRESWELVLDWINIHSPTSRSASSDVQQWVLVVGLALRDIYTVNSIEPDEAEDVPNGGPNYLRTSTANLRDALEQILPLCSSSQHVGVDPEDASIHEPHHSSTLSHKASRLASKRSKLRGKPGKPPGIPLDAFPKGEDVRKSSPRPEGDTSCEEVEMAVIGAIEESAAANLTLPITRKGSKKSAIRRADQLRHCYVELSIPRSRHSSTAAPHQPPPPLSPSTTKQLEPYLHPESLPTPPSQEQPRSSSSLQPRGPTDEQPRPPTDEQPRAPLDEQPRAPTDEPPRPPTDVQPRPPTDEHPRPPTDEQSLKSRKPKNTRTRPIVVSEIEPRRSTRSNRGQHKPRFE